MGTRSRVAVMHGDVCKSVYCHYDGYLQYTGEILHKHYDSTKANLLVSLGDNSGVKETVEEMNFYKDRGETDIEYQVAHTFEEFLEQVDRCCGEYYYVMRDGVWYAGCLYETAGLVKNGLVPLAQALEALKVAEDE
jgi:hypothetical protein